MGEYNSNSIIHYTALQHMRRRSDMWGFQIGSLEGSYLAVKEVIDNSIDEAIDPKRVYPIDVTFFVAKDKSTYQCVIQDRGRGVPVNSIVDVFTKEFTSGKYAEVAESYQSEGTVGTNGVGSKVVAALSSQFRAFTKRMDGFGYLHVEKGEVKDQLMTKKLVDKNQDTVGTTVMFQPDLELMTASNQMFSGEVPGIEEQLTRLEYYTIFKKNVEIRVHLVDGLLQKSLFSQTPQEVWKYLTDMTNFKPYREVIFDPQSPRDYVMKKFGLKAPIWELGIPVVKERDVKNPDDRLSYNIDIFIDEKTIRGEGGLIGAVNSTIIVDQASVHFTMLQNVLKMYMDGYVLDKDKQTFFETKYQIPLSGCVSVGWKGAGFDGQDKKKFTDVKFGDHYRSCLRRALGKLPESVWERLYELIVENFEMAYAKYAHSQYKINKNLKGIEFTLNRKDSYAPCSSEDPEVIELFITEGDSAAGRVMTVRDDKTQALFKLRGKPINAIRTEAKTLNRNQIYQDLMSVIGVRPTDTDLRNMRFKNILLMADADADGYHIVALLIGIFKEMNPLILEEGRVYITNPPLYSLKIQGEKKPLYLRDPAALMDAKVDIYRCLLDIYIKVGNAKEQQLTGKEYYSLCSVVDRIGDIVKLNADQLNIDPLVLEQLIHCVDYLNEKNVDAKKIRDILGVENVIWDKESNAIILVDHGFETQISLSHLESSIRAFILPEYERYNWKNISLFVTTKHTDLYLHTPCSFMMLYTIFKNITDTDNSDHFALRRFKGLGEMSEKDIYGTCIEPIGRCVSRIQGIGDVDRIYQMLGVDSEARKQLIDTSFHGKLVSAGFLEDRG